MGVVEEYRREVVRSNDNEDGSLFDENRGRIANADTFDARERATSEAVRRKTILSSIDKHA